MCWNTKPQPLRDCFGDRAFNDVIQLKWGLRVGPHPIWPVSLSEKEIKTQTHTEERPCEDTGWRQPSASQGERPQRKPTLLTRWSWTSSLQHCGKINFCCLSHQSVVLGEGSPSKWAHHQNPRVRGMWPACSQGLVVGNFFCRISYETLAT